MQQEAHSTEHRRRAWSVGRRLSRVTSDQPTSDQPPDQPLSLDAAADQLGVTREAVRLRIRRGTLRGEKRPDGWVVWLDEPAGEAVGRSRPTTDRPATDQPTDRPGRAERERELLDRIAWLETRIERAEDERSELRRMLFLEQQTVATLRAQLPPPAPPAESEEERGVVPAASGEGRTKAEQPDGDDRLGLHAMAHELERRRPWWWLRDWRKKGKS